jgi:hypothetical protein
MKVRTKDQLRAVHAVSACEMHQIRGKTTLFELLCYYSELHEDFNISRSTDRKSNEQSKTNTTPENPKTAIAQFG